MYLLACWLLGWLVGWSVSRLFRRGRSVSPSVIPSWSVGQSVGYSVVVGRSVRTYLSRSIGRPSRDILPRIIGYTVHV